MRTRCRFIVFSLSVVALAVLSVVLLLRPSPSVLVPVAPTSGRHKVSVILCTPHSTARQVSSTYNSIKHVLSKNKLEHEFFVVSLHLPSVSSSSAANHPLKEVNSYHVLTYTRSCTESAYYALEHSHYSIILYLSSNITSLESMVPKLVKPILQGKSDLVLLDNTSKLSPSLWQKFLQFLLIPITMTTYVSDTPSFAISSSVWFHGCRGVNSGRGSLTVDLVSRCVLKDWQEVQGQTTPPHEESYILFSQVVDIWWDRHPFGCIIGVAIVTVLTIVILIKCRRGHQNENTSKLNSFDL